MIHPFQQETSNDGHEHPDGLEHVRQTSLAASRRNCRAEQIVEPEYVHDIEILQPRPAVSLDRRIPAHRPVAQPRGDVNSLHAILVPPPAKWRPFCRDFFFWGLQSFFQPPIRREDRDLVAAPPQSFGKRSHLHRGAAEFQKGSVRLRDVQDSHCSRRIFFNDFAKTLKRKSCSARCFARAPISFAWTGSASSVSMLVASWIGSPCGTR